MIKIFITNIGPSKEEFICEEIKKILKGENGKISSTRAKKEFLL